MFVIITNLEIITIMCKISTSYGVILLMGGQGGGNMGHIFVISLFVCFFIFFIFQFSIFIFFVEVVLNGSVWVVCQVGTREWWSV